MDARASTGLCGGRLLVIQPAMGFGPARLVMAPAGVAGARLPRGVHAVEGIIAPAAITVARLRLAAPGSTASSRRHTFVMSALPGGRRVPAFLAPPVAGAASALDRAIEAVVAGAGSSSSSTRRRGVVARGATTSDFYDRDDDDDSEEPVVLTDKDLRSKRDIASWVELARLQTTFQVAFDAGVLKSGTDLRRVLDAIGDIDIIAPGRPYSTELCHYRIHDVIGKQKLDELLLAKTPKDDHQFGWSALAAQSVIEAVEDLMATLHCVLHHVPNLHLSTSCPMILKQLLKVVCEFSTIIESTKLTRPRSSIRFRMLEAHALALEHVCAISLDVYEEALQKGLKKQWIQLKQELRNRRITLSEEDMGIKYYLLSIGLTDTERVYNLVKKVAVEIKKRASAGPS